MRNRKYWMMVAAGIFIVALPIMECHDNSIESLPVRKSEGLKDIIPFRPGDRWIYRVVNWNMDGADTTADTVAVLDTLQRDGRVYYRYTGVLPSFNASDFFYCATVDSMEFAVYMSQGNAGKDGLDPKRGSGLIPYHVLKLPLKKGNEWVCMDWDTLYIQTFGTITITDTNSTIQLPDTTLHHALHCVNSEWGSSMDIVPGIGIVRVAISGIDSGVRYELIGWSIR